MPGSEDWNERLRATLAHLGLWCLSSAWVLSPWAPSKARCQQDVNSFNHDMAMSVISLDHGMSRLSPVLPEKVAVPVVCAGSVWVTGFVQRGVISE